MKMFVVVKFLETDEVEIISSAWLNENEKSCFWPPFKTRKLKKALLNGMLPESSWQIYDVEPLGRYASYNIARKKLMKAEYASNLDTDLSLTELEQPSKKPHYFSSHSESDDEDDRPPRKYKNIGNSQKFPMPQAIENTPHRSSAMQANNVLPTRSHSMSDTFIEDGSAEHSSATHQPLNKSSFSLQLTTALEKEIFCSLEDIRKTLTQHTSMLNSLVTNCITPQNATTSEDFPVLPLRTQQELENWENFIEDISNFKKAAQYLLVAGGSTIDETVRRVLRLLFSYELASQLNWVGHGGKRAFKNLKTKLLLFYVMQTGKIQASEYEVETIIKSFLKYAPSRLKYQEAVKR